MNIFNVTYKSYYFCLKQQDERSEIVNKQHFTNGVENCFAKVLRAVFIDLRNSSFTISSHQQAKLTGIHVMQTLLRYIRRTRRKTETFGFFKKDYQRLKMLNHVDNNKNRVCFRWFFQDVKHLFGDFLRNQFTATLHKK